MWHDLQAAVATTAWFIVTAVAKLVCERWQESHFAVPAGTGMWVAGLPVAVTPWQVSQVPVPTAFAAECANVTPLSQLAVDRWQPSQVVTVACVALFGLREPGE